MDEDSIIGSQGRLRRRGLTHPRRTLKEKLSQDASASISRVLEESSKAVPENDVEDDDDSVIIQSQKNKSTKGRALVKRRKAFDVEDSPSKAVHSPSKVVYSPSIRVNEDSITPSRRTKGLIMKRFPKSPHIRLKMMNSVQDVDQFFTPNFESTRLLNITAPLTPSRSVVEEANLSTKSLYLKRLSLRQVVEGGTQVTPLQQNQDHCNQKENENNISLVSIYKQKLQNKLVSEGGTQTTPTPEVPSNQQDSNLNDKSEKEALVNSNTSNSSIVSGFINELCQTQSKEILVPFTEKDFDNQADGENSNDSLSDASTLTRVSNPEVPPAALSKSLPRGSILCPNDDNHENQSVHSPGPNENPPDDSIHENQSVHSPGPNENPPDASIHENNRSTHSSVQNEKNQTNEEAASRLYNSLDKAPSNLANPTSTLSDSDSEIEFGFPDTSVRHQPDKIMKKLTPGDFFRRYGAMEKEHEIQSENGPKPPKKYARKSIHIKKGSIAKFDIIESIVSVKEGFDHFSLFCPYDLNKKAKETFIKVSQEILTDIVSRVTDEAFYNSGRTNVCLRDVKQVMLQYKCFPPSPKDARYKNQHLYRFLRQNCDAKAAKCLLPMSSFAGKGDKFFVDIWEEVYDENPKETRNSKRSRRK